MNAKQMAWVSLFVTCTVSVGYIFTFGVDWEFIIRVGDVPSAVFTALVLSGWAAIPYLILLPIARREKKLLLTPVAFMSILAFGIYSLERGRHTPGDEGGSYIVVPLQQMLIAAALRFGWRGIQKLGR